MSGLVYQPEINEESFLFIQKSGLHGQETSLGNMFQSTFQMPRSFRMGPCGNCKLIDSGDVAFYGVTCPECGEVPPSKKHLHRGIGRLLLNVRQNAAAPALVAANDARDNQQSDTPGVSPSRLAVVDVDFEK